QLMENSRNRPKQGGGTLVKSRVFSALLLGVLLAAAPGRAEQATAPAPAADVQPLRAELDRLRQEAEQARRMLEERIGALEQKIEDLQKAAPPPAAAAPNPVTT